MISTEGIELDMAVSHLSRFVLVHQIVERLGKNLSSGKPKPRVFIMGFSGKDRKATLDGFNSALRYHWPTAHSDTVVGKEALVMDCADRYPSVNFYGLNPGIMRSNIMSGNLGDGFFALPSNGRRCSPTFCRRADCFLQ